MVQRWMKLSVMVVLAACAADMDGMRLDVVASITPAANATGVARDAAITMDAGTVMDTTACRDRMVLHMGDSTGSLVAMRLTWTNGGRTMVLTPEAPLAPLTTYFVHVRDSMLTGGTMDGGMMGGGMMDGTHTMMMQPPAGAMRMADGMGWSFTTGN